MLCATTIKELQNIIKEDYGKKLTIEQSADIANTLVQYFDLLAKIVGRKDYEDQWIYWHMGHRIILLELTSKKDKVGLYLTSQNYEQK